MKIDDNKFNEEAEESRRELIEEELEEEYLDESLDIEDIEDILQYEAEEYAKEFDKQFEKDNLELNSKIVHAVFDGDKNTFKDVEDIDDIVIEDNCINWINIVGVDESDDIITLQENFDLHPLIIQNIFADNTRTKTEKYDKDLYVLTDFARFDEDLELNFNKVSLILRDNLLITILNDDEDIFNKVRIKLEKMVEFKLESSISLMFILMDELVDNYFELLDDVGEKLDDLEDELIEDANEKVLHKVYVMKKNMLYLRKSIQPLRSVVNKIYITSDGKIDTSAQYFFREVYNHIIQMLDLVEVYRDTIIGLIDTYTTIIGNKTNDVMMILTVWSTIFLPLSFLTGVFGMNFKYMPELENPVAYPLFWIIVVVIIIGMLIYFKRKDWI